MSADSDRSVPRKRLSQRFTLIETNHADLKESLRRHYPDSDSFVEDWISGEFDAQERIAALERFYERIVNSLNQIVDVTEKALDDAGELPGPATAKPGKERGRWQRLADYGALPVADVEPMRRLVGQRNIFQKEYDTLGPEAGAEVFDAAKEFSRLLPKVVPPIRSWVDSAIE
jgi:uncharacterized protein YutE (UPF0331/DUF86 family)